LIGGASLAERAAARAVTGRYASRLADIDRLVQATLTVIQTTDAIDPPIREILRVAGVAPQAFYRRVSSKDELMLLVLDHTRRQFHRLLERHVATAATPRDRVAAWVAGVLEITRSPVTSWVRPLVVSAGRLADRYPAEMDEAAALLTSLIERAIVDAVADGTSTCTDPAGDARTVYEAATAALQRLVLRRTPATDADVDQLTAFALRGAGFLADEPGARPAGRRPRPTLPTPRTREPRRERGTPTTDGL
jgi:AcrR family transcriptional regulator